MIDKAGPAIRHIQWIVLGIWPVNLLPSLLQEYQERMQKWHELTRLGRRWTS